MKKRAILVVLSAFLILFFISLNSAIPLTQCQTISTPGVYDLTNNIMLNSPEGTACFIINSNNVTIDGHGYNVSINTGNNLRGVYAAGFNNINIENISFKGFKRGIYFSEVINGTISNSYFENALPYNNTFPLSSYAIFIDRTHRINIFNNKIKFVQYGVSVDYDSAFSQIKGANNNISSNFISAQYTLILDYSINTTVSYNNFSYSGSGDKVVLGTGSVFSTNNYLLTLSINKIGKGTVRVSDNQINCGTTCEGYYINSTSVNITAIPDSGNSFFSMAWSGPSTCSSFSGNGNICNNFTIAGNTVIDVYFSLLPGTISACGAIASEGSYNLASNMNVLDSSLSAGNTCLDIIASNVLVNGNGFTINGSGNSTTQSIRVANNLNNVTVTNFTLNNFVYGILTSPGSQINVKNNKITNMIHSAFFAPMGGGSSTITNNTFLNNGRAISIHNGYGGSNFTSNNISHSSVYAIEVSYGVNNLFQNNFGSSNAAPNIGSIFDPYYPQNGNKYLNNSLGNQATLSPGSINSCGVISESGVYNVANNFNANAIETCIRIDVGNVVINGNGFTINGSGNSTMYGIRTLPSTRNITISNINLNNFTNGIQVNSLSNVYIFFTKITNMLENGFSAAETSGIVFTNNVLINNGRGIYNPSQVSFGNFNYNNISFTRGYAIEIGTNILNNYYMGNFGQKNAGTIRGDREFQNSNNTYINNSFGNDTSFDYCAILDKPGNYSLKSDLINSGLASGGCIHITSENVTFDGRGYQIIKGTSNTEYGIIIESGLKNIKVHNTSLIGFGVYAGRPSSIYPQLFNITLRDLSINGAKEAIITKKLFESDISNNFIINSSNGIGVYDSYMPYPPSNNTIQNNFISQSNNSILLNNQTYSKIFNNTIINSQNLGITLFGDSSNNVLISSNRITNYNVGIYISEANSNLVEKNNLTFGQRGIDLEGLHNSSTLLNYIVYNTLRDNYIKNSWIGIIKYGDVYGQVLNNTILNSTYGIFMDNLLGNYYGGNNQLSINDISYSSIYAIDTNKSCNNDISYNFGNSNLGLLYPSQQGCNIYLSNFLSSSTNLTINSPLDGSYVKRPVVFNVTLYQDSNVRYSLNNGLTNFTMISSDNRNFYATNTTLGDGNYTVKFYISGINEITSRSFIVDGTPPNIEFSPPTPPHTSTINNSVYINLSTNDSSHHYSFIDMDSAKIWMQFNNQLTDYFGKYNGSINGVSAFNENGMFGKSVSLDGNSYISVLNNPSYKSKKSSYSLWINPTNLNNKAVVSIFTSDNDAWEIFFWNGYIAAGNYPWAAGCLLNNSITINSWNHVVATRNESGYIRLYVNNQLCGVGNNGNNYAGTSNTANLFIGSQAGSHRFKGEIDEFILFNKELSSFEIGALYNSKIHNYQNNFTSLTTGQTYNFTAYAVDKLGSLSSVSRLMSVKDAAITNVTSCRVLNTPNTVYNLKNNVTYNYQFDAYSCFEITANNITFNGNNYTINSTADPELLRVGLIVRGLSNITIKNLKVNDFYQGIAIVDGKNINANNLEFTSNELGLSVSAVDSEFNNITYRTNTDAVAILGNVSNTTFRNILPSVVSKLSIYAQAEDFVLKDYDITSLKIDPLAESKFTFEKTRFGKVVVLDRVGTSGVTRVFDRQLNILNNSIKFNLTGKSITSISDVDTFGIIYPEYIWEEGNPEPVNYTIVYGSTYSESDFIDYYVYNYKDINGERIYSVNSYDESYLISEDTESVQLNITIPSDADGIRIIRDLNSEEIYRSRDYNQSGLFLDDGRNWKVDVTVTPTISSSDTNASANLTFYSLPRNFVNPVIFKDINICTTCINYTSLNAGNVTIRVSEKATYRIGEMIRDPSPPVISNLVNSSILHDGATITWNTDDISDSVVYYGTTASYGDVAIGDSGVVHNVSLTGLMPNTAYNYKVSSTNINGNQTNSSNMIFRTSASTIIIFSNSSPMNGQVFDDYPLEVEMTFTTNVNATCSYSSVPNLPYSSMIPMDPSDAQFSPEYEPEGFFSKLINYFKGIFTSFLGASNLAGYAIAGELEGGSITGGVNHLLLLSNLSEGFTYQYYFKCLEPINSIISAEHTIFFIIPDSAQNMDSTPPVINTIRNVSINTSAATITWNTDDMSDSVVYYGTTSSYGNAAYGNFANNHTVLLNNLVQNTTYHYKVSSTNINGNQSNSTNIVFRTLANVASNNSNISSNSSYTSTASWQNIPIASQNSVFTLSYDSVPSAVNIDGVTGISSNTAGTFSDLAVIARFNDSGSIDARNGGNYNSVNSLFYASGVSYHFEFIINITNRTYSLAVTPNGGNQVIIANNYSFRTEQTSATQLANIGFISSVGSHTISNITLGNVGMINASGLVGYWNFNEGNGNIASDSSGNNNSANLFNSIPWVPGRSGNALNFDGENDFLNVSHSSSLDITNAITVSAWINFSSTGTWQTILSKLNQEGTHNSPFFLYMLGLQQGNQARFFIATGANTYADVSSAQPLIPGNWYHIVGTYDRQNIRIYINGNLAGTVAQTNPILSKVSPVRFGTHGNFGEQFKGILDEVRIYNRSLNSSEIYQLYSQFNITNVTNSTIDTSAPIINNIINYSITNVSAIINWTTDDNSTSVVYYGLTTSYGNISNGSINVTNHTVLLSGLAGNTTYNYKVSSTNTNGNQSNSSNFAFTTLANPVSPCNLTSAYWNTLNVIEGQQVTLVVNGTSCNGQQLNFVVWEDDILGDGTDDPVITNPSSVTIVNGTAQATWIAEWQNDASGNPEYYFIATLSSNSSKMIRSSSAQELNVNPIIIVDATPPVITNIINTTTNTTVTINWTTDDNSTSVVYYGTTTSYGLNASGNFGVNHSVLLNGLTANTIYNYKVSSTNVNGNQSNSSNMVFRTLANPVIVDATPPVISNIVNTTTNTTATITWTTDDLSNTVLLYGLNSSYGFAGLGSNNVTFHVIVLSGLIPNTTYNYKVMSTNANGNQTNSTNMVFRTLANPAIVDATPPIISNIINYSITNVSAIINWTTDDNSSSTVYYGLTSSYGNFSIGGFGTNHLVSLSGLSANTTYNYKVSSTNANGNQTNSTNFVFRTAANIIPNRAPVVSDITHDAIDVDTTTAGLQIYANSFVSYLGSAIDPDGNPISWEWIYTINGGAIEYIYSSGLGPVQPTQFYYGPNTAGINYLWKLRVYDGSLINESQLTVNVVAQCGNNILETGEICDGNSQTCLAGIYTGSQACNAQCNGFNTCIASQRCGDGQVNGNPLEQCDDGNINNTDACSNLCQWNSFCTDTDKDGMPDYDANTCPFGTDRCVQNSIANWNIYNPIGFNTNFNGVDLRNVSNFSIEQNGFAKIVFNQPLRIVNTNTTGCFVPLNVTNIVTFTDKRIIVRTQNFSEFSKPAVITMQNVTFTQPKINRDGIECASNLCPIRLYNTSERILVFEVPGFSAYEIIEGYVPEVDSGGEEKGSGGGGGGGGGAPVVTSADQPVVEEPTITDNDVNTEEEQSSSTGIRNTNVTEEVKPRPRFSIGGLSTSASIFSILIPLIVVWVAMVLLNRRKTHPVNTKPDIVYYDDKSRI